MSKIEAHTDLSTFALFSSDLPEAERLYEVFCEAGLDGIVTLIAYGRDVDRALVFAHESGLGQAAPGASGRRLVERFGKRPRYFIDGCWAVGSLPSRWRSGATNEDTGELLLRLRQLGFSDEASSRARSVLKKLGGVLFVVYGPRDAVREARALPDLEGLRVFPSECELFVPPPHSES